MKSYIKSKSAPALGFRTPDFFKASKFGGKGGKPQTRFNPSQFKIQHKGGS